MSFASRKRNTQPIPGYCSAASSYPVKDIVSLDGPVRAFQMAVGSAHDPVALQALCASSRSFPHKPTASNLTFGAQVHFAAQLRKIRNCY